MVTARSRTQSSLPAARPAPIKLQMIDRTNDHDVDRWGERWNAKGGDDGMWRVANAQNG